MDRFVASLLAMTAKVAAGYTGPRAARPGMT